jgi:hypothetical protein
MRHSFGGESDEVSSSGFKSEFSHGSFRLIKAA